MSERNNIEIKSEQAEWFSCGELKHEALPDVPTELARISNFISRVQQHSPDLVRERQARGGGLEVHLFALPDAARRELEKRRDKAAQEAHERQALMQAEETVQRIEFGLLEDRQQRMYYARQRVFKFLELFDLSVVECVRQAKAGTLPDDLTFVLTHALSGSKGNAKISERTLYRWSAARYSEETALALAPKPASKPKGDPAWAKTFLEFYQKPVKLPTRAALRLMHAAVAAGALPADQFVPTQRQANYYLHHLPYLDREKDRQGILMRRVSMAYRKRDVSDLHPTSVYVADGKTFDAEVAHPITNQPFRPEITTLVDAATRRVVSWSASLDESGFGVADALRKASVDNGIPAIFYSDRGPGYKSKTIQAPMVGLLSKLGTTAMMALPYNSQAKGVVERVNQIYTDAAKSLATFMGRDMDPQARKAVFKQVRGELKEFKSSKTLPAWAKFLELMERTVADYNARPHSSLPKITETPGVVVRGVRHMSPDEFWAKKVEGFDIIRPLETEEDELFRPWIIRRTNRALVSLGGNSYFHLALEKYHGRDVIVGYDIKDAAHVWVREIAETADGDHAPGKLICVAYFEGNKTRYVPIDMERQAMERRVKAQLARLEAHRGAIQDQTKPHNLIELTPVPQPMVAAFDFVPSFEGDPLEDVEDQKQRDEEKARAAEAKAKAQAIADARVVKMIERPIFKDDAEMCLFLIKYPNQLRESDCTYLIKLLSYPSAKETLRQSGVDLKQLKLLLVEATTTEQRDAIV
jgi:putative transposase